MAYHDDLGRILLWIAACSFFVIFLTSIWYWFYVYYYKKESSSSPPPRANGRGIPQQTQYGAAQHQAYQGSAVRDGNGIYELQTVHQNPQGKAGGEAVAATPVANPPRSATRDNWGSYQPDQAPMNILSPLSKEGSGHHSQNHAGGQRAIEPGTNGRRHYSVSDSHSSGTPQMTPETGSSPARTPEGQRTSLPKYTLEARDTDPPTYAESGPSHHAAPALPRRPIF